MIRPIAALKAFAQDNRTEIRRFVKFGLVGTIGAGVDFGILNLGIRVLGLEKWLANTFSFFAAALSNFTWNRLWTFPESRARPMSSQLGQFLLVSLVGYGINQGVFLSLDRYVFAPWGIWGYNLAKAIATVIVLFWNFRANRLWTYREIR